MATDVPMPKLGLTMEEATILEWLVEEGADVEPDQPIMLIATDKTETEVGSPGRGRLHRIGREGEVFACGVTVGRLLADGEEPSASQPVPPSRPNRSVAGSPTTAGAAGPSSPTGRGDRLFASPNARRVAAAQGIDIATLRGTGPGGRIVSEDVEEVAATASTGSTARGSTATHRPRVPATFAARALADLLGVDIGTIDPTAGDDRIDKAAVARHVRRLLHEAAPPMATPEPSPQAPPRAAPSVDFPLLQVPSDTIPLTGMRGTIAKRMRASLHDMAQLTLTMDADMDAVVADRRRRKADEAAAAVPSYTDYVVAATARALRAHPLMNAQVTDQSIAILPTVHVGLAVAVDNGLLVPVVTNPTDLSLEQLAVETARLAQAARQGSLSLAALEGGTFSVSALGAFGVDSFTPVINPPNAGILGIGRLRTDVVADAAGTISTVQRLTLSLTWDHRVLDGAPAAEFCRTVAELLGQPDALDR